MGYYTSFSIDIVPGPTQETTTEDIIADLRKDPESWAAFAFNEQWVCEDTVKWYDYEIEMLAFSKEYPDTLFILSWDGEESDDFWKHFFRNWKWYRVQWEITYPFFSEADLK